MPNNDFFTLKKTIENASLDIQSISPETKGEIRDCVLHALDLLDKGTIRVAEKQPDGKWKVNEWLKKSILLSFRLFPEVLIESNFNSPWWDKDILKFTGWTAETFKKAGFRAAPGSIVRRSAFIAPNVILMPCFVNLGAYVDSGTMVDTWASVGSCAQIGKNVHLSGGVGIGGVLEPMQNTPTIIEDDCFIGARSEVVEGCIIRKGCVLGMGVYIGKSTKIVDRETGEVFYGEVPPYSVVIPGAMPTNNSSNGQSTPSLYCAVIVKRVDEKTRASVAINEILRN